MSTRTFDAGSADLVNEGIEPIAFAMIDFIGDPQFIHSAVGVISWGGEDWSGIGVFGHVEAQREQLGAPPSRLRVSLTPVAAEYLNSALNENTWGRLFELYLGNWNGTGLVATPQLLFRGRMGPPEVMIGGSNSSISIQVEDIRGALDRTNGMRATLLDHQVEAAGDTFYEWLPKMMDHKFVFNGKSVGAGGMPVYGGSPAYPEPYPGYNDQFLF